MRRKSLRIQITAAVGIIVTLACLALTANSIYSANNYYAGYLEDQSSSEAWYRLRGLMRKISRKGLPEKQILYFYVTLTIPPAS